MDLYTLQQNLYNAGEHLKNVNNAIADAAASPADDAVNKLKELQAQKADIKARYDALNAQYEQVKKEQAARFKPEAKKAAMSPKDKKENAFAKLVRHTMAKESVGKDVMDDLGGSPLADNTTTGGQSFLPKTVSTDIISEPTETNPLRGLSVVTQIPNLEVPRIKFTLDDNGFIEDTDTAKEIEAKGDTVAFTRNKFKVQVGLSETVLLGSNAALSQYVMNALRDGVTVKERSVAFAPAPTVANEKHMSFYDPSVGITSVSGSDLYDAITKAVADLHESYRENATIVMSYADYLTIIKTLANGSATLYSAQPEQILGKPVVFTDAAVKPIVGDFSFSQYNYDINTVFDQDKDIHTGINYFVVTAWFDHQITLSSAFRIADVATASTGK